MARWKSWTGLWTGLDWTGLFFGGGRGRGIFFLEGGGGGVVLFFLQITFSTFPQQAIFFLFWGAGGRGVVLHRLYSTLLFVGFVLCLSF